MILTVVECSVVWMDHGLTINHRRAAGWFLVWGCCKVRFCEHLGRGFLVHVGFSWLWVKCPRVSLLFRRVVAHSVLEETAIVFPRAAALSYQHIPSSVWCRAAVCYHHYLRHMWISHCGVNPCSSMGWRWWPHPCAHLLSQ